MANENRRTVEVYTAGCPCCDAALKLVRQIASDREVSTRDMRDPAVAREDHALGIRVVPAVVDRWPSRRVLRGRGTYGRSTAGRGSG